MTLKTSMNVYLCERARKAHLHLMNCWQGLQSCTSKQRDGFVVAQELANNLTLNVSNRGLCSSYADV
jgi:hypothetical protein